MIIGTGHVGTTLCSDASGNSGASSGSLTRGASAAPAQCWRQGVGGGGCARCLESATVPPFPAGPSGSVGDFQLLLPPGQRLGTEQMQKNATGGTTVPVVSVTSFGHSENGA